MIKSTLGMLSAKPTCIPLWSVPTEMENASVSCIPTLRLLIVVRNGQREANAFLRGARVHGLGRQV